MLPGIDVDVEHKVVALAVDHVAIAAIACACRMQQQRKRVLCDKKQHKTPSLTLLFASSLSLFYRTCSVGVAGVAGAVVGSLAVGVAEQLPFARYDDHADIR
jgi:hypothetical protein